MTLQFLPDDFPTLALLGTVCTKIVTDQVSCTFVHVNKFVNNCRCLYIWDNNFAPGRTQHSARVC